MERLRDYKFEKLVSGQASGVEDFFEKLIKKQFVNKDAIKELHHSLMKYVTLEGATFFLRLYGSFQKDSYDLLRRGFLTEYQDKTRMVFCDNTFSMLFAGLKIAGISVSEVQLLEYLKQRQLICSFGMTSNERELSYYTPTKAIRVPVNSKGWYQAHIKSTGHSYEGMSENKLSDFFPNPDRVDWSENEIRIVSENLSEEQKRLLIAHFIRLVHPLNSFLVPKKNHIQYEGKRIGEELEVILYVRDYLKKEFLEEYKEFEEISMGHSFAEIETQIKDITWFEEPISTPKKVASKNKKPKTKKAFKEKTIGYEDEEDDILKLEKQLKSIGKEVFVAILFAEIRDNSSVSIEEIALKYPKFKEFKSSSQASRLSTAKSIFKNTLEIEALNIIIDSARLDDKTRELAKSYL